MLQLGEINRGTGPRSAFEIEVPIQTNTGLNSREHHFARQKRVKAERTAVQLIWLSLRPPKLGRPFVIELTRVSRGAGADLDNVVGGLKAIRDQVAAELGIDDGDELAAGWIYRQARGPWAVRIRVEGAEPTERQRP
jgi:hypothetical protein